MSAEPCLSQVEHLAEQLAAVPDAEVRMREPLARYTSFGVGGPADVLVMPGSAKALQQVMRIVCDTGARPLVLGNGTNLIVRDGGMRGVVVLTARGLTGLTVQGTDIITESGRALASLCCTCAQRGLAGMEFAAGIPGTLGGALIMNAGANGGEIGSVTRWVEVVEPDGSVTRYEPEQLQFGYRESALKGLDGAVLRACLGLAPGDPDQVHDALCEAMALRCARQPVALASAGSIFKRPEGDYAGRLLEEAGAKGMCVGGAAVSEKHANFIVNRGGATARDVLSLIEALRQLVYDRSGVMLEPEVCVVGEDAA